MNAIIPFVFEGAEVRGALIDGEPHLVGKDVAERLGYANTTDAISRHCKGVVKRYPLQTVGGLQELRVLAGPDVLRLIMGSKLPAAEKFERWVFEEVLPTILKTGSYTAPPPEPPPALLPEFLQNAIRRREINRANGLKGGRPRESIGETAEAARARRQLHVELVGAAPPPRERGYRTTLREAVQILNTTADGLEQTLRARGWAYPVKCYPFLLATSEAIQLGFLTCSISVEPRRNGRDRLIVQVLLTAKGLTSILSGA